MTTTAARHRSPTGTQQDGLHEAVGGPAGGEGLVVTMQALGTMSAIAMPGGAE